MSIYDKKLQELKEAYQNHMVNEKSSLSSVLGPKWTPVVHGTSSGLAHDATIEDLGVMSKKNIAAELKNIAVDTREWGGDRTGHGSALFIKTDQGEFLIFPQVNDDRIKIDKMYRRIGRKRNAEGLAIDKLSDAVKSVIGKIQSVHHLGGADQSRHKAGMDRFNTKKQGDVDSVLNILKTVGGSHEKVIKKYAHQYLTDNIGKLQKVLGDLEGDEEQSTKLLGVINGLKSVIKNGWDAVDMDYLAQNMSEKMMPGWINGIDDHNREASEKAAREFSKEFIKLLGQDDWDVVDRSYGGGKDSWQADGHNDTGRDLLNKQVDKFDVDGNHER